MLNPFRKFVSYEKKLFDDYSKDELKNIKEGLKSLFDYTSNHSLTSEKKGRKRFWTWKKSLGLGIFNYSLVASGPVVAEIGAYVGNRMDPPRVLMDSTLKESILHGLKLNLTPEGLAITLTPAVIAGISVYLGSKYKSKLFYTLAILTTLFSAFLFQGGINIYLLHLSSPPIDY